VILGKSALTATPESASSALSSRQERSLAAIDGVASFLGKIGKPRKDRNGMHFIEKKNTKLEVATTDFVHLLDFFAANCLQKIGERGFC